MQHVRRIRSAPRLRWLALIVLVLAALGASWVEDYLSVPVEGRIRPIDGDSFRLASGEVRLKGIDAPEGRQMCRRGGAEWPCGHAARQELIRLTAGRPVTCKTYGKDQHGRLLAVCRAGEIEINREMVARGMAVAFGDYEAEERAAAHAKRGLWAGDFERPQDWRRQNGAGG